MLIRFHTRPPAAFIRDPGEQVTAFGKKSARFPMDAHGRFERSTEIGIAARDDEEILKFQIVPRMKSARDDIDHRNGQTGLRPGTHFRQMPPERNAPALGGGARHGARNGKDGIRPEAALILRTVGFDEPAVECALIAGVEPVYCRSQYLLHVPHRLQNAFAAEARIPIAQFPRLMASGGCAGRRLRAGSDAIGEPDFGLHGGVAA